jgi:hypothetical protein
MIDMETDKIGKKICVTARGVATETRTIRMADMAGIKTHQRGHGAACVAGQARNTRLERAWRKWQ